MFFIFILRSASRTVLILLGRAKSQNVHHHVYRQQEMEETEMEETEVEKTNMAMIASD
jgi:hypothetical protein